MRLDIPARLQWATNHGYCGEVSLISAGLYYGQYVSQYEARRIASRDTAQHLKKSQLLLGVNDAYTAKEMRLTSRKWEKRGKKNARPFLDWVTEMVGLGFPVTIGLYMNQSVFHPTDQSTGDSEYDHIVPVIGSDGDRLRFSDNGLFQDNGAAPFVFHESFADLAKDRWAANEGRAPYAVRDDGKNYGIAITGVADDDHETMRVRVDTDRNDEPEIPEGEWDRPEAVPVKLTVRVTGLRPGRHYVLYRYADFESVPTSAFNAHRKQARKSWEICADSDEYVMTERIMSDAIAVYRAVPAGAR